MDESMITESNVDDSVLLSIKKLLGIPIDYDQFDTDIKMHINSTIITLRQLGVSIPKGFKVTDKHTLWTDYISDIYLVEYIKNYIYLKVRLLFDPPTSSIVTDSINQSIKELEWRIIHLLEIEKEELNADE